MVIPATIHSLREMAQDRPSATRNAAPQGTADAAAADTTEFSTEAREAAAIVRLAENIKDSEIRQAKVEEAKRRIEEGTYRLVEIVNVVAERISGIATA